MASLADAAARVAEAARKITEQRQQTAQTHYANSALTTKGPQR